MEPATSPAYGGWSRDGAAHGALRASVTLARLWQKQGKQRQASELLAPVYAGFGEGLDTRDVKDARARLEDLG